MKKSFIQRNSNSKYWIKLLLYVVLLASHATRFILCEIVIWFFTGFIGNKNIDNMNKINVTFFFSTALFSDSSIAKKKKRNGCIKKTSFYVYIKPSLIVCILYQRRKKHGRKIKMHGRENTPWAWKSEN